VIGPGEFVLETEYIGYGCPISETTMRSPVEPPQTIFLFSSFFEKFGFIDKLFIGKCDLGNEGGVDVRGDPENTPLTATNSPVEPAA
jgi:hypothetical protein